MELALDSREFEKQIALYKEKTRNAAVRAMTQNKNDLWKESAKLVAKDEGTLEGSGYGTPVKVSVAQDEMEATVGYNTPYAAKVHETMLPAMPASGKAMHPGETTESKPPTEFGAAGGKYLERPLLGKMKRYTQNIADKIAAVR